MDAERGWSRASASDQACAGTVRVRTLGWAT